MPRYRVNSPQVISETLDGETIIVNLATGHYFNLQGSAVDVWQAVERGEPSEAIVGLLCDRYLAQDGEIATEVERLVGELVAAELVVPEKAQPGDGGPPDEPASIGEKLPFAAPVLARFTDMQDIILLDPVHEVDARGWPNVAAGA